MWQVDHAEVDVIFQRKYSNEKTEECPVWDPIFAMYCESDDALRKRVKDTIEAEQNSFEARFNRYVEYLEHADCITTSLLAECERLRLECVPDCKHPCERWRDLTFNKRGSPEHGFILERGVECGICMARLKNGTVNWVPKSVWIKDIY